MPAHSEAGDGMTIDRARKAAAEMEERFAALSEEEQILTIAARNMADSYEVYDRYGKSREEAAKDFLTDTFGPKFAKRALENAAYRTILRIDEQPPEAGNTTLRTI